MLATSESSVIESVIFLSISCKIFLLSSQPQNMNRYLTVWVLAFFSQLQPHQQWRWAVICSPCPYAKVRIGEKIAQKNGNWHMIPRWYTKSPSLFWKSCFPLPLAACQLWWPLPPQAFPQLSAELAAARWQCGLQWALSLLSVSTSADRCIQQQRRELNKTRKVTYAPVRESEERKENQGAQPRQSEGAEVMAAG